MKRWLLPVTATVVVRLSRTEKEVMVGAEFASVVCMTQPQVEVLPICSVPFFVTSSTVAVRDFTSGMAFSSAVRWSEVSVIVRFAVPTAQLCAANETTVVVPFLIVT